MTDDVFDSPDSLDGESRHGGDDEASPEDVAFPAPDEILERQRSRYADRFRRKADAPPIQRRKRGEPFNPSPQWTRAFREQCTREMRNAVKRYAYTLSAWLEGSGVAAGETWVDEQIQKAITDTLDGRIRWRFDKPVPLLYHLRDTIRGRAWKIVERSKRVREVSVDHGHDDDHVEADFDEKPTEVEASLESRRGRRERDELATADLISKVLAGSRGEAAKDDDQHALRIHDAYDQGITEKAEVCELTGLSEQDYHNAHRRILRRAKRLREELQTVGKEALSREPD